MNNPKTLQSGPVAERTEQGNADFLKHEKAKLKKKGGGVGWGAGKVYGAVHKGQLLSLFYRILWLIV